MDFSKIREMRKQNKRDPSRASLGNEEELVSSNTSASSIAQNVHHDYHQNHSPTVCFFSYCYIYHNSFYHFAPIYVEVSLFLSVLNNIHLLTQLNMIYCIILRVLDE
ncbi:hypothetical protein PHJA_002521200 [Phtheirospermum japonicum]|uniref:Uncharacterized protein n=1 Tax=Phtheirospermum japonicum TaxID=374723 RepID=A0A830D6B4_9LAMI|nr:hypothetical protein PHJA_002521200 [Phtheirospermum japonicum]